MNIRQYAFLLGSFCYVGLTLQTAFADDTEIYVSRKLSEDQQIRPNLLFVIDNSGSMDAGVAGTECTDAEKNIRNRCEPILIGRRCTEQGWWGGCARYQDHYEYRKTRLQVVKDVTSTLIDELRLSDDVNVGLMHFDANRDRLVRIGNQNQYDMQGGMVAIPVGRVSTTANAFKAELDKLYAGSNTPLSETYYEAARYMKGQTPKFGNSTKAAYEHPNGYSIVNKASVSDAKNGNSYKSPIEYSCQKSNIILLTDGEPTMDNAANSDIRSLISASGTANTQYTSATCRNPGNASVHSGECMPHLAEHLANQDASGSQPGKQTVNTYTIGFATDQTLLQNTADAGNGRYFTTDNTSGLVDALKSILVEILAENTTFATPSVAVSAYNNLGYRNDLYYALFRPAEGARWVGNVKRYRAETTTDANGNTITQIVDKNGQPAIDESTGFFRDNSSSFWSSLDGRDVEKGGVAGTLNEPANRKIFTWTEADRSPSASTGSVALSSQLNENNSALTQALLGVNSSEARTKAIQWGRGQNPDSPAQARRQLADVLHNEPRLVAYKTDEDLERAGTATSPEQLYMFFGTNEGFIHAVDPSSGQEKFAFIPKELLPNLSAYYQNPKGSDQKRYGMDGQFNLWVEYGDLDINAKTRSISKSYLYAGMRRGGKNYYALDVTNIDQPKLKWVIKGGATPGFEKLGQTWSTPKLANIKLNGTQTKVLVFTGGYDPQQDNDSPNTPLAGDTQGNALYIVNAETGQLIWRAGHSSETGANLKLAEMTHSMPADPVIIDANGDGLADIIYAVDARAQVFRFDIDNASSSASALATGGRIAKLGGDTALDNRRFFSMPDVAMVRERGGKSYFAIAIGSGYRAHPLNEDTIDRFYVLQDGPLFSKPKDGIYTTLTEDDLLDVSSVDLTDAEAAGIQEEIAEAEAAIAALNQAVAAARDAFNAYKESSGFTSKYNAMLQANNAANSLQAEIDALMASDPYLQAHAAESSEQSKLQQGLLESQNTLKALQDAIAAAAPDLADKEDAYEAAKAHLATIDEDDPTYADAKQAYESAKGDWDAADGKQTARSEQRTKLAEIYSTLISLQAELNSAYQGILDQERAILDAVAASASESTVDNLRSGLETLNQDYGNHPAALKRDGLNAAEGSSTQLLSALNRLKDAIHRDAASQIDGVLADLSTQLSPLAPSLVESELLAREEAAKHTELAAKAANLEGNVDFAAELESQRLAQSGQASAAQAEANDIASGPYQASSALLNAEQLAAAKALYGNDLTMFEAYQFLLDQAQLAVTDSEDGVPALRKEINQLYGQLVPGNSYTPNPSLLAGSKGWFMRLPKGEKVLSSPLIFRGALFFTTFSPRGETITTCGPDVGRGRAYALNLRDASAILAVNDTPIRSYALLRSGIPPAPTVLFSEDGPPRVIIGTEVLNDRPKGDGDDDEPECIGGVGFCDKDRSPVSKTYWREN